MGSKLPAAVDERISKGERHDFGAAAPLPTRASSLEQGRAGGPVESVPTIGGRGYDDYVSGDGTKTTPSGDRTT